MDSISGLKNIYTFYDVMGNQICVVGNASPPSYCYLSLEDVGILFYSEPQYIDPSYQSYIIYMPGIWPGAAFCPEPVYAYGPCSPISTSVLSPGLFSFPSSPVLTTSGWQMSYSQTWTNVTGSPVIVSSVALVFGMTGDPYTPNDYFLYAAIVDNVTPAVVINPGYSVTFTYTLLYAV